MARHSATNLIAISALCFSLVTAQALSYAHMPIPLLPWIPGCLSTIKGVEGCIEEVLLGILSGQPKVLGPQCCRALVDFDDKCWSKLLPFNPLYSPAIKSFCIDRLPFSSNLKSSSSKVSFDEEASLGPTPAPAPQ